MMMKYKKGCSELFFTKKSPPSLLEQAKNVSVTLNTKDKDLLKKLSLISFNEFDLRILKTLHPIIERNMDRVVKDFYDVILTIPELKKIIYKHSSVERLQSVLFPHLLELFSGIIDEQYVEKRLRVARVHYIIGLEPAWYLASFQEIQSSLITIITENVPDHREWPIFIRATTRILNIEQQLVLEAYENEQKRGLEQSFTDGREEIKRNVLAISESLSHSTEETYRLIENLVDSSKEVEAISSSGYKLAVEAKNSGETGKETLQTFLQKIIDISEQIEQMNTIVKQVEHSSEQITNVIRIVEDIAEKTNLLVLNSAIEAARAGEYGKGFAVVADEVRKLADQTKNSISTINELILYSTEYTKQLVDSLQIITKNIDESNDMSRTTYNDVEQIVQAIDNNLQTNRSIEEQVEKQNETSHEIEQVMHQVVDLTNKLQQIVH